MDDDDDDDVVIQKKINKTKFGIRPEGEAHSRMSGYGIKTSKEVIQVHSPFVNEVTDQFQSPFPYCLLPVVRPC